MQTLCVLVASIMTVTAGSSPENETLSYGSYESNEDWMVAPVALDEIILPEETGVLEAVEEISEAVQGESYSKPKYTQCNCRHPGFYLGGELTLLRPYVGSPCIDPPCFPQDAITAVRDLAPQSSCSAAPRVWLGYTDCSGLGFRVRWWQLDQTANENVSFIDISQNTFVGTISGSFDVNALDFEITDTLFVGHKWDLTASGGVRYAKFRFTQSSDGELSLFGGDVVPVAFSDSDAFEGVGGTAAIELHRNVLRRVGVFTNVRGCLLYGNTDLITVWESDSPVVPPSASSKIVGVVRSIWEAQLGIDWTRELGRGLYLTSRVAGEVQYWDAMVANTDAGFAGMTFALGLIR